MTYMASHDQVRDYLAYWFQLGKAVIFPDGRQVKCPQPVQRDRFSSEFESHWQQILAGQGRGIYLEGTVQSIEQLLSDQWDIIPCARCTLPVPIPVMIVEATQCPCYDLEGWPNTEVPLPRLPVNNQAYLGRLQTSLRNKEAIATEAVEDTPPPAVDSPSHQDSTSSAERTTS